MPVVEDPKTPYPKMQAFPARHFLWEEVRCHHCRDLGDHGFPSREVLEGEPFKLLCKILDGVRGYNGKPLIVTSWYRCLNHPIEAAKRQPGVHACGIAADIRINRVDVLSAVESILHTARMHYHRQLCTSILGIGFAQKGDMRARYVHVDVGGMIPEFEALRGAVWTY